MSVCMSVCWCRQIWPGRVCGSSKLQCLLSSQEMFASMLPTMLIALGSLATAEDDARNRCSQLTPLACRGAINCVCVYSMHTVPFSYACRAFVSQDDDI